MIYLLWFFYAPLIRILSILFVWHPKVRERLIFETKNTQESLARSFKWEKTKADLCFEFSSEGEYQQVASLIQDALDMGKKLELIFFSPSVEKGVLDLAARYPTQIRYLRFPLLRSEFLNWITAEELILVRYDLFPEFLIWSKKRKNKLKMIWVSFKKSRLKSKNISWYKRQFLKTASLIVYASVEDQHYGEDYGFKGPAYDFRIDQIKRRIMSKELKFQKVFPGYAALKTAFDKYPREKRVIIGNAWPSDLFLLESLPTDLFVLIVPHKLESAILKSFEDELSRMNLKPELIKGDETSLNSNILILNKKGVLCELYADFGRAYVGGGFETSIHSVLEPLVAGSERISCGPIHFRSTEYDIARGMGRITEVNLSDDFGEWLKNKEDIVNTDDLEKLFGKYNDYRKEILSC